MMGMDERGGVDVWMVIKGNGEVRRRGMRIRRSRRRPSQTEPHDTHNLTA